MAVASCDAVDENNNMSEQDFQNHAAAFGLATQAAIFGIATQAAIFGLQKSWSPMSSMS
jgi:hypothetical protein